MNSKLQLDHLLPQLEVAPSGERLRRKGRHGVIARKTVWSMPERFEIYIIYKRHYINTLPFLFPFPFQLRSPYGANVAAKRWQRKLIFNEDWCGAVFISDESCSEMRRRCRVMYMPRRERCSIGQQPMKQRWLMADSQNVQRLTCQQRNKTAITVEPFPQLF